MGAEAFREYRRAYNIGDDDMKSTNKQLCFDDYDIEIINRDDRDILFDIISDLECDFIGFNESNMPYLRSPVDLILCVDRGKTKSEFWAKYRRMYDMCNNQINFYDTYKIPKKSKGYRTICSAKSELALYQKYILNNILNNVTPDSHAMAYRKGISFKDTAKEHIGKDIVVKIDIKDFFHSVTEKMVYKVFDRNTSYEKSIKMLFTKLCTVDNHLPQGACTSPALANLAFKSIDEEISELCNKQRISYTRYSDDMYFSGQGFNPYELIYSVKGILYRNKFSANDEKTRIYYQGVQQRVLGVCVNNKLQMPKEYRKHIRQEMYYIKRYGVKDHILHLPNKDEYIDKLGRVQKVEYLRRLYSRIQYVLFINPNDKEMLKYKNECSDILHSLRNIL